MDVSSTQQYSANIFIPLRPKVSKEPTENLLSSDIFLSDVKAIKGVVASMKPYINNLSEEYRKHLDGAVKKYEELDGDKSYLELRKSITQEQAWKLLTVQMNLKWVIVTLVVSNKEDKKDQKVPYNTDDKNDEEKHFGIPEFSTVQDNQVSFSGKLLSQRGILTIEKGTVVSEEMDLNNFTVLTLKERSTSDGHQKSKPLIQNKVILKALVPILRIMDGNIDKSDEKKIYKVCKSMLSEKIYPSVIYIGEEDSRRLFEKIQKIINVIRGSSTGLKEGSPENKLLYVLNENRALINKHTLTYQQADLFSSFNCLNVSYIRTHPPSIEGWDKKQAEYKDTPYNTFRLTFQGPVWISKNTVSNENLPNGYILNRGKSDTDVVNLAHVWLPLEDGRMGASYTLNHELWITDLEKGEEDALKNHVSKIVSTLKSTLHNKDMVSVSVEVKEGTSYKDALIHVFMSQKDYTDHYIPIMNGEGIKFFDDGIYVGFRFDKSYFMDHDTLYISSNYVLDEEDKKTLGSPNNDSSLTLKFNEAEQVFHAYQPERNNIALFFQKNIEKN